MGPSVRGLRVGAGVSRVMAQSQNRPIPNSSRGDAPALACLAVLRVGATGGVVSQPKGGSVVAFHAEVKLFGPQRIDPSSIGAMLLGRF